MEFKINLKQLRIDKGLKQKDVALILNITESGYAHWEQGRTEPSIKDIKRLADFFDVSTDYLLGREEY